MPQERKIFVFRKSVWVLALVFVTFFFAGAGYLACRPQWVYAVTVDSELIGHVASLEEFCAIVSSVQCRAEEYWGCSLAMNEEVKAFRVRRWNLQPSPVAVAARLEDMATYTARGWAIVVDAEPVALLDSRSAAEEVLEAVKAAYLPKGSNRTLVSAEFQEEVTIESVPVDPRSVMEKDAALSLLLSGEAELKTYVVQRGDTLPGIARAHNTSLERLRQANPGLKGDTIQVGQVLNLERSNALLHVKTVEDLRVTETIPRPVRYTANPDMSVRHDIVLKSGSDGKREVVYRVEKVNGKEVRRRQISSTVTRAPETKEVMTGIGYWPARPTGMFRFPLNSGKITSKFGVVRPTGPHRGVDIAAPKGTPIYAAADGIVRTRAYSKSYGYYVELEHSDGYSTLYAHVSRIDSSVQVGKKVVRGQVIAWVGSTGFSTGPHLHWEVRRYDNLLNPMNFFAD